MKQLQTIFTLLLVATFFVTDNEIEAANSTTYEVGVSVLHVREEPTNQSSILGILNQGDQVTAFNEEYGWVQTYYAGEIAWVAKHYLVPTDDLNQPKLSEESEVSANSITVTAPSVHIRSGPGTEYQAIAGASQGESFEKQGTSGDWIHISFPNGNTGWIASWVTTAGLENTQETEVEQVASAQTTQEETISNGTLSGKTIVLDAGHGGKDPGAIGLGGIYEKDIVLSTATTVADVLRSYGANVIETRTADYYLHLNERSAISNSYYTDAFISIHYNSFPVMSVQGMNTFYYDEVSMHLAEKVHTQLTSRVALHDRGINQAAYKVLRNTSAPAVLLELGFISNAYDLSVVQTSDFQQQTAEAIAQGLIQYFN